VRGDRKLSVVIRMKDRNLQSSVASYRYCTLGNQVQEFRCPRDARFRGSMSSLRHTLLIQLTNFAVEDSALFFLTECGLYRTIAMPPR